MSIVYASSIEEIRAALDDTDVAEIRVAPGDYYVDDHDAGQGFVVDHDVAIVSSVDGERANFHARADFQKGIFLVKSGASATFDGIGFYDTRTLFGEYQEGNEAGIRHEGDLLTIKNSFFQGNSNAILGSDIDHNDNKHLVVENSTFIDNGRTSQEHHIYFIGNSVDVSESYFSNSHNGHAIKTVVSDFTRVTNSTIDDSDAPANHAINVTGGGDLFVSGNTITKSSTADNPYVIFYVPQRGYDSGTIVIEDNTIHTDWDGSTGGTLFLGNFSSSVAQLSSNTLTGSFATNLIYGLAEDHESTINGRALSEDNWSAHTTDLTSADDVYYDTSDENPQLYSDIPIKSVNGGDGDDVLIGQSDDRDIDVFLGGAGADFIDGGDGIDFLYGDDGDDVILTGTTSFSSPVDFASGGEGNDWIIAGSDTSSSSSAAFIVGGQGDDFIDATRAFSGSFLGDGGNDIILGASYRDWLNGGSGDDFLYGGTEFDILEGGDGIDTVIYAGSYGIDLTVEADYRLGDVRIVSLIDDNQEVGSRGWETAINAEFIQFANGVLDTHSLQFVEGVERFDLARALSTGIPLPNVGEDQSIASISNADFILTTYTTTVVDTASVRNWQTITRTFFEASDQLVSEERIYDNGNIRNQSYSDGVLASSIISEADGDVRSTLYSASGVRQSITFEDGSDSRSWESYTNSYDEVSGKITSQELLYDNGNTRSQSYTDGTIISRIINEADGDVSSTLYSASGVRQSITFEDGSDSRNWESYINSYDEVSGKITAQELLYDNGNTRSQSFIDGTIVSRIIAETDGDVRTTLYSASGVRQSFTFEDGSDSRNWESYTNSYDEVSGEITAQELLYDNGDVRSRTYVDGVLESSVIIPAPPGPPRIIVTGDAVQGEVLSVAVAVGSVDDLNNVTYQWLRDDIAITGAVGGQYQLGQDDVGASVTVTLTYENGDGDIVDVTSNEITGIANINDAVTGTVTISGDAVERNELSVSVSLDDEDGLGAFSYQWERDSLAIEGATGSTYLLTQEDVGSSVSATVSFIDGFGTLESITTASSDEIERYLPPFEPPVLPETSETIFAAGSIFGTSASETIIPTSGNVQVQGGDGDDVFQLDTDYTRAFGGSGSDVFFLQGQNQHATGGAGNDTFVIAGPLLGSVIHDFNAEEDTLYFANAVGKLVHFDDLADAASQVDGDVLINTAVGQVLLEATELSDLTQDNVGFYRDEIERPESLVIPETGEAITGSGWITGTDANDLVISGGGNIRVSGGFGDDHLIAEHWGVRILGGSGNDVLEARDLYALFYGGSGTDQFYFTDRVDGVIGDFQSGLDQVVLSRGLGFENSEDAFAALTGTDAGAILLSSNGDQLLFANLEVSQLDQGDFIFV